MPNFGLFATGFFSNFGYDIFKNMFARGLRPDAQVGITMKWNISNFYTFNKTKKKFAGKKAIVRVDFNVPLNENGPLKPWSQELGQTR